MPGILNNVAEADARMKELRKYAQRRFKTLIMHLENCSQTIDPKVLHQIRVEIKKIKAVISVIKEHDPDFDIHQVYLPLRDIFKTAGQLRENEINSKLAKTYHLSGMDTDDKLSKSQSSFPEQVPRFIDDVAKAQELLDPHLIKVNHGSVLLYITKNKLEVKSSLFPFTDMESIHKIRKRIKELIYLSRFNGANEKQELNFFKKLERVIGKLHDKQVLLKRIEASASSDDDKQRNKLKDALVKDRNEIFRLSTNFYSN